MSMRKNLEKINRAIGAWESIRPEKSYAGMTLKQFKNAVQPALDMRVAIQLAESTLISVNQQREAADREALETIQRVVAGVKADKEDGDDSAIWEALGYIRRSDRKSGLTRSKPLAASN